MAKWQRGNGGFRKKCGKVANIFLKQAVPGQSGNGGFGKALPICGNGAKWQRYYSGKRRPMLGNTKLV